MSSVEFMVEAPEIEKRTFRKAKKEKLE